MDESKIQPTRVTQRRSHLLHTGTASVVALVSTFLAAAPASAYLEPGTATYVIQTVVAAIFSSLYLVKLNWQRLKTFFKSRMDRGDAEDADS